MRRVFMLLSSKSLPYARTCIRTMMARCADPIRLRMIADDADEKARLVAETEAFVVPGRAEIEVVEEADVADLIAMKFPGLTSLQRLHAGNPCWRKIIDPIALSDDDDEIIVADPDLFFPNRFDFEPTPQDGVLLMRQGPNCLYPADAVRQALDHGLRLANHVDIGVAQMRVGAIDPEWLDWAIEPLVAGRYHGFMHIEAIVWSAMATRIGGRHFDPQTWRCWERGRLKRLAVAAGIPGRATLRLEPIGSVKCMHFGGQSKWWLEEALRSGDVEETGNRVIGVTTGPAYVELTRAAFDRERLIKETVWKALRRNA